MAACRHCQETPIEHQDEHEGLCCDCYDLSWGMPLAQLNEERKKAGKPAIDRPYPGRDKSGNVVKSEILA